MAFPLNWPEDLIPTAVDFHLQNISRSGGQTLSGIEQVVVGPGGGFWAATLTIPMRGDNTILALRALRAGLHGRAGTVYVPTYDQPRSPWRLDPLLATPIYPNESLAGNPDLDAGLVFTLGADAAINASHLTIARSRGGALRPGQYLSLSGRLHMITALDAADDGTPATVGVSISPWLRGAYSAGAAVDFMRPSCMMRMAQDDTAKLSLELMRFGTTTIDFVEAF